MDSSVITIVICCAGMGTRLGIGNTKALIDVCGKPLITRLLEQLDDFDDIRIVVGYQAEKVIQTVNAYRKDIMYAFNYQYETTGVGISLTKGIKGAREYVVALDGDIVIHPHDFQAFLNHEGECIGGCKAGSDEPVYMKVDENHCVTAFDTTAGDLEWSGILKVKKDNLELNNNHVYKMLETALPLPMIKMRMKEIDTPDDYEKMISWYKALVEN